MTHHGNGDLHRANPDPVEQRDRELGRAEYRDWDRSEEDRRAGRDERAPDEIERDIERTRADMDETLDALQRKLSPGQLMDQALDYLRNGPGGFASNLGSRVRDNPIPVALTAVALGWLMMAGGREEKDRTRRVTRYHYRDEYRPDDDEPAREGGVPSSYGEEMGADEGRYGTDYGASASPGAYETSESYDTHGARQEEGALTRAKRSATAAGTYAAGMAHDARDRVEAARRSASGRMSDMRYRATGAIENVRGTAGGVGYAARSTVGRTRDGFNYMLDEHPLVLGVLGLAVGAIAGASLPSTRREGEWLGEARDEFVEHAKHVGRDEAERVGRVAESATQAAKHAAKEEADRQGLTSNDGGDVVERAASGPESAAGAAEAEAGEKLSSRKSGSGSRKSASSTTDEPTAPPVRNTEGNGI